MQVLENPSSSLLSFRQNPTSCIGFHEFKVLTMAGHRYTSGESYDFIVQARSLVLHSKIRLSATPEKLPAIPIDIVVGAKQSINSEHNNGLSTDHPA